MEKFAYHQLNVYVSCLFCRCIFFLSLESSSVQYLHNNRLELIAFSPRVFRWWKLHLLLILSLVMSNPYPPLSLINKRNNSIRINSIQTMTMNIIHSWLCNDYVTTEHQFKILVTGRRACYTIACFFFGFLFWEKNINVILCLILLFLLWLV